MSVDITEADKYDPQLLPESINNSVDIEFEVRVSHSSINTVADSSEITINYGGDNVIAETGRIQIPGTINQGAVEQIDYQSVYKNPIISAYIPTRNGDQSVDVRARNVSSDSCELFLREPDDGSHPTETVCYVIAEKGSWTTQNGYHIEVGSLDTDSVHDGLGSDGSVENPNGVGVSFTNSFDSVPVVLGTINTNNNDDFASTVIHDTQTGSFKTEQTIAETESSVTTETIGWFAIEQSSGEFSTGSKWKAKNVSDGDGDSVENTDQNLPYSSLSLNNKPDLISSMQTLNG